MLYNFLFPQQFRGKGVSLLLLVVRIVFGILFFMHGLDKLVNFNTLVQSYPSEFGFGSYMTLMLSIFTEFCCSLFLITGLLVRLMTIPMIVAMGVAFFDVHDAMMPEGELESMYGIFDRDHDSRNTGELLCYSKRLGQKTLNLPCPVDGKSVLVRKFIHAEDRYDVLKFLVSLEYLLYPLRGLIMILSHYVRVKDTRGRLERIHSRINTQFSDFSAQDRSGVEMGERSGRGWVSKVVRRHIYSLYGSNRTILCGCDSLLHLAHLCGQCRLISYS